jgi:hypothetical protein
MALPTTAWFAGSTNDPTAMYLAGITPSNQVILTAVPASTNQPLSTLYVNGSPADNSVNILVPDGILAQMMGAVLGPAPGTFMSTNPYLPSGISLTNSGAIVYTATAGNTGLDDHRRFHQPSSTPSSRQPTTSTRSASRPHPDLGCRHAVAPSGRCSTRIGRPRTSFRIVHRRLTPPTGSIVAGQKVTSYMNKFYGNTLDVEVHPYLAARHDRSSGPIGRRMSWRTLANLHRSARSPGLLPDPVALEDTPLRVWRLRRSGLSDVLLAGVRGDSEPQSSRRARPYSRRRPSNSNLRRKPELPCTSSFRLELIKSRSRATELSSSKLKDAERQPSTSARRTSSRRLFLDFGGFSSSRAAGSALRKTYRRAIRNAQKPSTSFRPRLRHSERIDNGFVRNLELPEGSGTSFRLDSMILKLSLPELKMTR